MQIDRATARFLCDMFIKRIGPYRFYFNDHWDDEPPHVRVVGEYGHATFWLGNVVLIEAVGLALGELEVVTSLVKQHEAELLEIYGRPGK